MQNREWEGSSVKDRGPAVSSQTVKWIAEKYAALVSHFRQKAWCQEKCLPRGAVHAHGPFRGTAPRGGHSALPRGESGVRRMEVKIAQSFSDLGAAEGASPTWAETRAFRASGARSRGQFRRAIAPDRGLSQPRTAPNNCPCARATLCCFETAIAVGSILGERITPKPDQRIQGSSAHIVYNLAFVCTYQAIEIQLLNACLASVLLS